MFKSNKLKKTITAVDPYNDFKKGEDYLFLEQWESHLLSIAIDQSNLS